MLHHIMLYWVIAILMCDRAVSAKSVLTDTSSDDKLTWSVVHRVIHKDKVHIVLVLVVEADFLHATLPQI